MLHQAEADRLITMRKWFRSGDAVTLRPGDSRSIDLDGEDPSERFALDLWRGTIRLTKVRYQNRARGCIALVRLELDSAPHTNPDGTKIGGTHVHIFREGYEDKWAMSLDPSRFSDPGDFVQTFRDFCDYCNIDKVPPFQEVLL